MKQLFVLFILCWSGSTYAYLDPGTGSILIQGAIAAIAGAMYTIKLYWYQIKAWFSRSSSESSQPENDDAKSDN